MREDEIAAAAIGVDTTHHKVTAFVIGAFFAGVAGGLFAHWTADLDARVVRVHAVDRDRRDGRARRLGSISGAILGGDRAHAAAGGAARARREYRMIIYSLLLIAHDARCARRACWARARSGAADSRRGIAPVSAPRATAGA